MFAEKHKYMNVYSNSSLTVSAGKAENINYGSSI
jgi:hypothetical protein